MINFFLDKSQNFVYNIPVFNNKVIIMESKKRTINGFKPEEDEKLIELVNNLGTKCWTAIAKQMPGRNARQCRERQKQYLDPSINKDDFTEEEDKLLLEKIQQLGTEWKEIKNFFLNRTETQLKNRFNFLLLRETNKQSRSQLDLQGTDQQNTQENIPQTNVFSNLQSATEEVSDILENLMLDLSFDSTFPPDFCF